MCHAMTSFGHVNAVVLFSLLLKYQIDIEDFNVLIVLRRPCAVWQDVKKSTNLPTSWWVCVNCWKTVSVVDLFLSLLGFLMKNLVCISSTSFFLLFLCRLINGGVNLVTFCFLLVRVCVCQWTNVSMNVLFISPTLCIPGVCPQGNCFKSCVLFLQHMWQWIVVKGCVLVLLHSWFLSMNELLCRSLFYFSRFHWPGCVWWMNSRVNLCFFYFSCCQCYGGSFGLWRFLKNWGKMVCRFHGLESRWKINNSTQVFESLWILTSSCQ